METQSPSIHEGPLFARLVPDLPAYPLLAGPGRCEQWEAAYSQPRPQTEREVIPATMLAYGKRRLLTFNIADFRRYADHIELVAG